MFTPMAVVAQLVEHLIVVQDVAGSSPVDRPSLFSHQSFRGNLGAAAASSYDILLLTNGLWLLASSQTAI